MNNVPPGPPRRGPGPPAPPFRVDREKVCRRCCAHAASAHTPCLTCASTARCRRRVPSCFASSPVLAVTTPQRTSPLRGHSLPVSSRHVRTVHWAWLLFPYSLTLLQPAAQIYTWPDATLGELADLVRVRQESEAPRGRCQLWH